MKVVDAEDSIPQSDVVIPTYRRLRVYDSGERGAEKQVLINNGSQ